MYDTNTSNCRCIDIGIRCFIYFKEQGICFLLQQEAPVPTLLLLLLLLVLLITVETRVDR